MDMEVEWVEDENLRRQRSFNLSLTLIVMRVKGHKRLFNYLQKGSQRDRGRTKSIFIG